MVFCIQFVYNKPMPDKNPGGRPVLEPQDRISVQMIFRVRPRDAELIRQAAEGEPYLSLSGWMRDRVLRAAKSEVGIA